MRTHTLVAAIAVIFSVYFAEAHAQQNATHKHSPTLNATRKDTTLSPGEFARGSPPKP